MQIYGWEPDTYNSSKELVEQLDREKWERENVTEELLQYIRRKEQEEIGENPEYKTVTHKPMSYA